MATKEEINEEQFIAGLSARRPGFNPWTVHVKCLVDAVYFVFVSLRRLWFLPVSIIPPMLHTRSFTCHRRYTTLAIDIVK
jgi:hypothetical protein